MGTRGHEMVAVPNSRFERVDRSIVISGHISEQTQFEDLDPSQVLQRCNLDSAGS